MLGAKGRQRVISLIIALLAVCWVLARHLEPQHREYVRAQMAVPESDPRSQIERTGSILDETPFHAIVPAILGVRELTASLLWLQVDSYFHRGEYEPILDLIYRIVAIDPHQIDVYATGAWHIAYNFLDERLIWDGVKFLEEGCRNNPHVYDLFFELGYTHMDKTKDFPAAIHALQEATRRGTTSGDPQPPAFVFMQLAHAMERAGWIDQAEEQWRRNVELVERLAQENPKDLRYKQILDVTRKNYYLHRRRRNERRAAELEREGNAAEALRRWEGNVQLAEEMLRLYPGHEHYTQDLQVAKGNVARIRRGDLHAEPLPEIPLEFTVRRIAPRQLEVSGSIDVLDLSRVRIIFQDKNYAQLHAQHATNSRWRLQNLTLDIENVQVRNGKFKHVIRLDRDPAEMGRDPATIYPLRSEEYELIVQYDPRLQALFIQDRYGWNGEGLASRNALRVDHALAGTVEGRKVPRRYLEKRILLKRDEIV